ncbi:MAG: glycosyltransferase family 4 protein, partial [Pseudomonadota bacterium]
AADRPDLWFTSHLSHQAPDWTGPAVAKALNISYVAAEASYAQKQAKGRWAEGLEATRLALGQAGAVFALSRIDEEGLRAHVQPDRLHRLAPFIDTNQFLGARSACPPDLKADIEALEGPILLAIGMMRPGDKLASYQILGQALEALMDLPWSLLVVGDGPARSDIEAALPTGRTHFAGALSSDVIPAVIAKTDLMVWPAINEAYGMALLEAQAGGVPVIAGASGGVPEIIADGHTGLLTRPGDPLAFAEAVRALLVDPAKRRSMASAAQQNVRKNHDISSVAAAMNEILPPLARSVATSA